MAKPRVESPVADAFEIGAWDSGGEAVCVLVTTPLESMVSPVPLRRAQSSVYSCDLTFRNPGGAMPAPRRQPTWSAKHCRRRGNPGSAESGAHSLAVPVSRWFL